MPGSGARGLPPHRIAYAAMGLLLAVLLLGGGALLWLSGGGSGLGGIGGPFALVGGDGRPVTDRDFRGKYMLVYFGYTFCPDVCPTTLNAVGDAMERLGGPDGKVRAVFITVDPKRDTPQVVRQYAAAFGPGVTGLTGSAEQIAAVAKAYRVYYAEHRTGPGAGDYTMDHSSVLYLMDPQGGFVAPIRADLSGEEIAASVRKVTG
jgi:protein SCO1/2